MNKATETAEILSQALPYIQAFQGKTIVIKYGGNAMIDENLKENFARDVILLKSIGVNPIVIHGGGPQIGELLEQLEIKSQFIDGMRITDQSTLDVVEMVLGGKINKDIVRLIQKNGGNAVGITGKDGNLLMAKKYQLTGSKKTVDLGFVGQVESTNTEIIDKLTQENYIPIIAPIATSKEGDSYNVNADLVASAIAKSLKAEKLLLLTNTPGVLDQNGQIISGLNPQKTQKLIEQSIIKDGMLPKVECALDAVKNGVNSVHIIDGRLPHSILLEILTDEGVGTLIHQ